MIIPENRKHDKLHKKIADKNVTIEIEYCSVEQNYMSFIVSNEYDALVACHCYQGMRSKIEGTTDNRFMVVIYKDKKD